MTTALTTTTAADLAEQVAIAGDLAKLSPEQRMAYYGEVCRSMGLNPLTRPFEYIMLNDKLTLYARRDATDQLRKIHGVNISIVARETVEGVYVVTARATTANGRSDESVGAVPLFKEGGEWKTAQNGKRYFAGDGTYKPLNPEDRANAMMKAETKAKRRVTLSVVGLGWLDETELETIPSAKRVQVNDAGDVTPDASYEQPVIPPASDKQRGFIAGLTDKIGWNSEQLAVFADEQRIDLVAMTKNEASALIEQLQRLATEGTSYTPDATIVSEKWTPPSQPVVEIRVQPDPLQVGSLKKLRVCEENVIGSVPKFTQAQAKDAQAVELEWIDSRRRLYDWISNKVQGAPGLGELDDQGLIDLAYATAGL